MKKILLLLLLTFLTGCSEEKSFVGLWQFPGKAVWIKIEANGNVFQCRMPNDTRTITSKGVIKDNKIIWEKVWGEDILRKNFGTLYLKGKYGEFGYKKAKHPMNELCMVKSI